VRRATCLVERSEKIVLFKKASDTHSSTYFYYALVFSVVCMIGECSTVYKVLDPSSEYLSLKHHLVGC
jgi:hypothetical protein